MTTGGCLSGGPRAEHIRPQVFYLDGRQLRLLRRQRGLSQQKLADNAGVSVTTVARLERRACAPCRGRTLGRLARALGQDPVTISHGDRADGYHTGAHLQEALAGIPAPDDRFAALITDALASLSSNDTDLSGLRRNVDEVW